MNPSTGTRPGTAAGRPPTGQGSRPGARIPGLELSVPVEGAEVWAEDTGGDGAPLVLMHPPRTTARRSGTLTAQVWHPARR